MIRTPKQYMCDSLTASNGGTQRAPLKSGLSLRHRDNREASTSVPFWITNLMDAIPDNQSGPLWLHASDFETTNQLKIALMRAALGDQLLQQHEKAYPLDARAHLACGVKLHI